MYGPRTLPVLVFWVFFDVNESLLLLVMRMGYRLALGKPFGLIALNSLGQQY